MFAPDANRSQQEESTKPVSLGRKIYNYCITRKNIERNNLRLKQYIPHNR